MKRIIKKIAPPIIFDAARNIFARPCTYSPLWNTVEYPPLQGLKLYFDPTGSWQRAYLDGSYDRFFFDRLSTLDLRGKVIYDIGAHIGFHSFYFARLVGLKGRVYAFEPHPKNVERMKLILNENKDIEPIVTVIEAALSNKRGTEKFGLSYDIESGRSSGGFIDSADTIWDREAFRVRGFKDVMVKTLPLDEAGTEGVDRAPDIMKIDVEGAESLVLEGARKTIVAHRPLILLEVHSIRNMFDVLAFFSSVSYETKILKEEKDGRCFIEARPR